MTALVLLVAAALACFGWMLPVADPPRVGQALAYGLTLVLAAERKALAPAGGLLALVLTYIIWAQAAGLACTAWYEGLSSREVGVCDEGTGLPVSLVFAAGLLIVAAEFLATKGRPR